MKIKTILLLFLSLLSLYSLSSERSKLDSLWNVWQDKSKPDTVRLESIHDSVWDGYLFSNSDSTHYFAQLKYNFAKKQNLKKWMADTLTFQGKYADALNRYKKTHQKGEADYPTFCNDCANSGIEKWIVDLDKMTCTYFSSFGEEMLIEQIPQ